jgi:3-oxoacyl-[acyl-carrier protein] reductase
MDDPFSMTGRVALVTGASQGLGRRFAQLLAARGAAVALAARQTDKLGELEREITADGGRATSVALDVTDRASIAQAVSAAEAALGPIDVLINNAGVAVSRPILEQTEDDWDRVLDTNLKGAFFTAQAVAKRMVERGQGGVIVNVASAIAQRVVGHLAPYAASKGGLCRITETMALELARHGIRVNALAPGYVVTDINRDFLTDSEPGESLRRRIPQRRFGEPEDLDGALLLLASDASRYMTGTTLVVDGGLNL